MRFELFSGRAGNHKEEVSAFSVYLELVRSLLPLALMVGAGAILGHRKVLSDTTASGLSDGLVYLFLPCLIFGNITVGLTENRVPFWWTLPLMALALSLLGALITLLVFRRRLWQSPDLFPLGFMQNAGYLVVAIGLTLVPPEERVLFGAYTFLFVLGYSPLLWSVGKYLISRQPGTAFRWRSLLTPPLFANLLAVLLITTDLFRFVPASVNAGIALMGSAAVPISMVVLGITLGSVPLSLRKDTRTLLLLCTTKLVLIPAVAIPVLYFSGLKQSHPLLALMLLLQAASPQASNLVILIRTYGGNMARTGAVLLLAYSASLVCIPAWVALWQALN